MKLDALKKELLRRSGGDDNLRLPTNPQGG